MGKPQSADVPSAPVLPPVGGQLDALESASLRSGRSRSSVHSGRSAQLRKEAAAAHADVAAAEREEKRRAREARRIELQLQQLDAEEAHDMACDEASRKRERATQLDEEVLETSSLSSAPSRCPKRQQAGGGSTSVPSVASER